VTVDASLGTIVGISSTKSNIAAFGSVNPSATALKQLQPNLGEVSMGALQVAAEPAVQSPYLEVLEYAASAGATGTVASAMRYPLSREQNTCGSDATCTVQIQGLGIHPQMCTIIKIGERLNIHLPLSDAVLSRDDQALRRVFLNGYQLQSLLDIPQEVRHGDRLVLGYRFCFRFIFPSESSTHDPLRKLTAEESLREVTQVMARSIGVKNANPQVNSFLAEYALLTMEISEANAINCSLSVDLCNLRYEIAIDGRNNVSKQASEMPELGVRLFRRKMTTSDLEDEEVSYLEPETFRKQIIGLRRAYAHWFQWKIAEPPLRHACTD